MTKKEELKGKLESMAMTKEELQGKLQSIALPGKDIKYSELEEIASALFNDFQIDKNGKRYDFVEIEFYIYNEKHPDAITYKRECEAGYWFFHPSGVDIAFKSELKDDKEGTTKKKIGYGGGILIRSISTIENNELRVICGPIKCEEELFDKFDAFEKDETYPIIVEREEKQSLDIISCPRYINNTKGDSYIQTKCENWGYKNEEVMKEYLSKNYRFYDADYEVSETEKSKNEIWNKYAAKPKIGYIPKGFKIT